MCTHLLTTCLTRALRYRWAWRLCRASTATMTYRCWLRTCASHAPPSTPRTSSSVGASSWPSCTQLGSQCFSTCSPKYTRWITSPRNSRMMSTCDLSWLLTPRKHVPCTQFWPIPWGLARDHIKTSNTYWLCVRVCLMGCASPQLSKKAKPTPRTVTSYQSVHARSATSCQKPGSTPIFLRCEALHTCGALQTDWSWRSTLLSTQPWRLLCQLSWILWRKPACFWKFTMSKIWPRSISKFLQGRTGTRLFPAGRTHAIFADTQQRSEFVCNISSISAQISVLLCQDVRRTHVACCQWAMWALWTWYIGCDVCILIMSQIDAVLHVDAYYRLRERCDECLLNVYVIMCAQTWKYSCLLQ